MNDGKYYVLNWCACSDAKLFGGDNVHWIAPKKGTIFWGSKLEIIADKFDWILGKAMVIEKLERFPFVNIIKGFMCLKSESVIHYNLKVKPSLFSEAKSVYCKKVQ